MTHPTWMIIRNYAMDLLKLSYDLEHQETNPLESWDEGYHEFDTQKLTPIVMPFRINDCVLTTDVLTGDNAYMIPGSRAYTEGQYVVLKNQLGIIDLICEGDSTYKVNFGAAGIWYVRPELLKLRDEAES